ncbi:hypothetical protein COB11_03095 [Candidatus Aerophobetes bacterium]|uniref:Permease n=1 Tax=Aerophobetes bacterium TaxID=2030807 RepID=A0A2A4YL62_UNCAE|nr:MAG: hypothetical protein COB11_03095 [Candidatus Aerophobetes bacterium]
MIWKKYLYRETLKTLFSFLTGFYILYIVMDYSIHAQHFSKMQSFSATAFFIYYLCHIIKRLEMMLPLAFLISTIKVLLQLNQRNELIALFASGLQTSKFLRPFFLIASISTLVLFANFQFFVPKSLDYLENFENMNFRNYSYKKYETSSAYSMPLQSGGSLIFGKYFDDAKEFEDVYFIKTHNEVYKMKSLLTKEIPYTGNFVECFKRTDDGILSMVDTYEHLAFNDLAIDFSIRKKAELPFEHRSITNLYKQSYKPTNLYAKNAPKIKSQLYFKLLSPFIPFLVLMGAAPFCIRSSRRIPAFFIYALSLFSFITFFIILDAAVILGENNTLHSLVAVPLPFLICFIGGGCHYYRHTCK